MEKIRAANLSLDHIATNLTITEYVLRCIRRMDALHRDCLIDEATDRRLTYGDLIDRVRLVTSYLSSAQDSDEGARTGRGGGGGGGGAVLAGDVVAIVSDNAAPFLEVVLSLWGLRTSLVFMSPATPSADIQSNINELGVKFIVATEAIASRLMNIENIEKMYTFKSIQAGIMAMKRRSGWRDAKALNNSTPFDAKTSIAAYVFSSGTTGRPKAIGHSHYSIIANSVQSSVAELNMGPSTLICLPPFSHMYGLFIVLVNNVALCNTLVVPAKRPRFSLDAYLQTIQKYKVSFLHMLPNMVNMMMSYEYLRRYDLTAVNQLLIGADILTASVSDSLAALFPDAIVRQGYGMSEMLGTHTSPITGYVAGSIGRLLPLTQCKIIDIDTGTPVVNPGLGELYIKGPQLMKGYHGDRAAETPIGSDGWLRTGDVGYVDFDGNYFISHRIKELIKYNGHQVSPAHVESVLLRHAAVLDAAVVGRPDPVHGELPTAFIVTAAHRDLELRRSIKLHVKNNMASYNQLRGGIVFIDQIPKLASGKMLRILLRKKLISSKL